MRPKRYGKGREDKARYTGPTVIAVRRRAIHAAALRNCIKPVEHAHIIPAPLLIGATPLNPDRAVRAPRIDGRDDDDTWRMAAPITGFRQFEPTEDGDPSFRTYSRNIDDQQWNGNFVDNGVSSYTFARLYQRTSAITTRPNYTITPTLSVESYLQPFVSTGEFTDWRALDNGRASQRDERFRQYSERGEPQGFRFGQLRTNNVVRWEYRPGSVLFFVWTQGRDASNTDPDTYGATQGFSRIFARRPENVFLIKASYWLWR